ncbi:hypothetical protein [Glycomyces sp. NPDC048151]|uniref:hypothetical protein n=1 Tax=Glycomyces sp. NPDC048151 TaxID=3364002 RepID=UPI0037243284
MPKPPQEAGNGHDEHVPRATLQSAASRWRGVMMGAQQRAQLNIGSFDLDGRRYRVYAHPDWDSSDDSVTVSRVHPDPAHGKAVMVPKGLDRPCPNFGFPNDWSEDEQEAAGPEILRAWRSDWRSPMVTDNWETVLPIYIGDRRVHLVRRPLRSVITAELIHHDGRDPAWIATFYRLDRGPASARRHGFLMRISWACRDWLGQFDGDSSAGVVARTRLRAAAWRTWMHVS